MNTPNSKLINKKRCVTCILAIAFTGIGCSSSSSTEQDSISGFTLSNEFLTPAVLNIDGETVFEFESRVIDQPNQEWVFTVSEDGSYQITNRALGDGFSLDVINDGVFETLIMAPTGDVSGQQWQVTPLDNGYCRLTNAFLGSEIALDTSSDTDPATITMRAIGDFSGQNWRFEPLGSATEGLEELCSGDTDAL